MTKRMRLQIDAVNCCWWSDLQEGVSGAAEFVEPVEIMRRELTQCEEGGAKSSLRTEIVGRPQKGAQCRDHCPQSSVVPTQNHHPRRVRRTETATSRNSRTAARCRWDQSWTWIGFIHGLYWIHNWLDWTGSIHGLDWIGLDWIHPWIGLDLIGSEDCGSCFLISLVDINRFKRALRLISNQCSTVSDILICVLLIILVLPRLKISITIVSGIVYEFQIWTGLYVGCEHPGWIGLGQKGSMSNSGRGTRRRRVAWCGTTTTDCDQLIRAKLTAV